MDETGSELSAVPIVNPEQPIQESGLSGEETLSLLNFPSPRFETRQEVF